MEEQEEQQRKQPTGPRQTLSEISPEVQLVLGKLKAGLELTQEELDYLLTPAETAEVLTWVKRRTRNDMEAAPVQVKNLNQITRTKRLVPAYGAGRSYRYRLEQVLATPFHHPGRRSEKDIQAEEEASHNHMRKEGNTMEDQSHKHVSVVLNEKEAQMLSKLLEYYRLPSYSDVIRSALHRMYYTMVQYEAARAAANTPAQRQFLDESEEQKEGRSKS